MQLTGDGNEGSYCYVRQRNELPADNYVENPVKVKADKYGNGFIVTSLQQLYKFDGHEFTYLKSNVIDVVVHDDSIYVVTVYGEV